MARAASAYAKTTARNINQEPGAAPIGHNSRVTQDMKDKARVFFIENREANAHTSVAGKARKELLKLMLDNGVKDFELAIQETGKTPYTVDVEVAAPKGEMVDVVALWKVMNCGKITPEIEKFLAVVSATKKSVEENVGKAVYTRCAIEKIGDENVTVKARKE